MTEYEIKKALECCTTGGMNCQECPCVKEGVGCINKVMSAALALIKKKEIK